MSPGGTTLGVYSFGRASAITHKTLRAAVVSPLGLEMQLSASKKGGGKGKKGIFIDSSDFFVGFLCKCVFVQLH